MKRWRVTLPVLIRRVLDICRFSNGFYRFAANQCALISCTEWNSKTMSNIHFTSPRKRTIGEATKQNITREEKSFDWLKWQYLQLLIFEQPFKNVVVIEQTAKILSFPFFTENCSPNSLISVGVTDIVDFQY